MDKKRGRDRFLMNRKLIGNSISSFGLGVLVSAIVHPLGFMESDNVFYIMMLVGLILIQIGRSYGEYKGGKRKSQ